MKETQGQNIRFAHYGSILENTLRALTPSTKRLRNTFKTMASGFNPSTISAGAAGIGAIVASSVDSAYAQETAQELYTIGYNAEVKGEKEGEFRSVPVKGNYTTNLKSPVSKSLPNARYYSLQEKITAGKPAYQIAVLSDGRKFWYGKDTEGVINWVEFNSDINIATVTTARSAPTEITVPEPPATEERDRVNLYSGGASQLAELRKEVREQRDTLIALQQQREGERTPPDATIEPCPITPYHQLTTEQKEGVSFDTHYAISEAMAKTIRESRECVIPTFNELENLKLNVSQIAYEGMFPSSAPKTRVQTRVPKIVKPETPAADLIIPAAPLKGEHIGTPGLVFYLDKELDEEESSDYTPRITLAIEGMNGKGCALGVLDWGENLKIGPYVRFCSDVAPTKETSTQVTLTETALVGPDLYRTREDTETSVMQRDRSQLEAGVSLDWKMSDHFALFGRLGFTRITRLEENSATSTVTFEDGQGNPVGDPVTTSNNLPLDENKETVPTLEVGVGWSPAEGYNLTLSGHQIFDKEGEENLEAIIGFGVNF